MDKRNGSLKAGTLSVIRSSLKTVIRVVGGIKSVFPLFGQLGRSMDDDAGESHSAEAETICQINVVLIGILAGLMHRNPENQRDMLDDKGFLLLAYLLENVWKHHTLIDTAIALKKTVLALVPAREPLFLHFRCHSYYSTLSHALLYIFLSPFPALTENARTVRDALQVQIYQRLFFNWDIWIHADANVQRQLLSDLTMQATENAVIDFRKYAHPRIPFSLAFFCAHQPLPSTGSLGFSHCWTSSRINSGLRRGPLAKNRPP